MKARVVMRAFAFRISAVNLLIKATHASMGFTVWKTTCIVIEKTLRHLLECARLFDRKVSSAICLMHYMTTVSIATRRFVHLHNLKGQVA